MNVDNDIRIVKGLRFYEKTTLITVIIVNTNNKNNVSFYTVVNLIDVSKFLVIKDLRVLFMSIWAKT